MEVGVGERERGEGRKEREDMEFAETNFSNSKQII